MEKLATNSEVLERGKSGIKIIRGGVEHNLTDFIKLKQTDGEDYSDYESAPEDKAIFEGSPAEQSAEEKQFKAYARNRQREGKSVAGFEFHYLPAWKQAMLLAEVGEPAAFPFATKATLRQIEREWETAMILYFQELQKRVVKAVER